MPTDNEHIERVLDGALPPEILAPQRLHRAMRHATLDGGKRLRARLVYATGRLFELSMTQLDSAAAAVEMIHAYSLIHDDLPAMDDDALRRGKPTVHIAFDEATAILAGDGLQAAAFEHITAIESLSAEQRLEIIRLLSIAVGFNGMVGGQALDLAAEHQAVDVASLRRIHQLKTGALIAAAAETGAICGGASAPERSQLVQFAKAIGLAFQVMDDVLDVTGDEPRTGQDGR